MKNLTLVVLGIFLLSLTFGCKSTQTRTTEGAVIGGIVGAAAGGIIGHQSHHGAQGAAIGAAAGVLTGVLVGSQMPKQQTPAVQPAQTAPANNPNQMAMQQIIDMSKNGVNEAVIIDRIRLTNSRFNLAAADIDNLKSQGVSQPVINAMQGNY